MGVAGAIGEDIISEKSIQKNYSSPFVLFQYYVRLCPIFQNITSDTPGWKACGAVGGRLPNLGYIIIIISRNAYCVELRLARNDTYRYVFIQGV